MPEGRTTQSEARRELIMQILRERDQTSVAELSRALAVSEVTVRKDLDYLEAQGLLTRIHGGAIFSGRGRFELHFGARQQVHLEEKRRIAAAAAALVIPGQSIFLDASTTALQIARLLRNRTDLTVVTNGLYTALELTYSPDLTVLVVGGSVRRRSQSLIGFLDQDLLRRIRIDLCFVGARGVTAREGLTESDIFEARLKQQVVAHAETVIGVADSSKFGAVHLSAFALPEEIDRIITDIGAPAPIVGALRACGITVDLV